MNRNIKRYLPLFLILVGIAIVYFTGLYHCLTFEFLKAHHNELKTFLTEHSISVPLLFILTYILSTALSIPGAVFLTLLGGYLFPQPLSTIYVVVAATCGATIIFLVARTTLGDSLKEKAGPFLQKMQRGFQKNAISYLLFLRFVPLFPFWAVNIAPAFFGVSLRVFVWTTMVGILPGSFAFTLAGEGLEKIFESQEAFSIGTIFNTQLKIALILLGVLALAPILIKNLKRNHD